jgi:hypothetical protein
MRSASVFYDRRTMKAMQAWGRMAGAYAQMSFAAAEVIARRTRMMASGSMSAPEAARMVMEKPATFAEAATKAAMAAVSGKDAVAVAAAAVKPIRAKTRANARRLRG